MLASSSNDLQLRNSASISKCFLYAGEPNWYVVGSEKIEKCEHNFFHFIRFRMSRYGFCVSVVEVCNLLKLS